VDSESEVLGICTYVLRGNDYPVGGEALREESLLGIQDTWTDQDIRFLQEGLD